VRPDTSFFHQYGNYTVWVCMPDERGQ